MNYSEQILKARFEQLPDDIKEAIIATPWKEKLKQISDKHNLHIDQAGHLGEETVLVMFGIEHADNLITNIAKHAEVSEEKAEAIAEDLNREIFLKVRESLKKIFEEKNKQAEEKMTEAKTETEEIPKREDLLRDIEDGEHHNLPTVNMSELHLRARPPSELSEQVSFQNKNTTNKTETDKQHETTFEPEQIQKQSPVLQEEALRTMPKDIVKAKMEGTVSVPKETVEMGDSKTPPKATQPNTSSKIDPYREVIK